MALKYSIISSQPSAGKANFSYDVGSAITEYVRSAPIGSQVQIRVTNLTSGTSTLLQEGRDYYTGAEGEVVIDQSVVPFGAQVNFSLNTDFNNFYDDFSDLGAAPAGPVKRRTQQLQNMALQLRDRIENLENGAIEVDLTETTITAGNVTYGPGAFQIDTADGIEVTDVAGTGFRLGLDLATIFSSPSAIGEINGAVDSFLTANPPASGVVTVSGRAPDGAGNIDLLISDVSDAATVATSGDYGDLLNTPANLSDFVNDQGFIGTADVTNIFSAINDKLDKSKLDGGLSGQVLKKMSNTDGDYAWATDSGGGGGGGGATQLDGLDDVDLSLSSVITGQGLIYNGTKWVNQTLTHDDITDFNNEVDARITAVGFDGDYGSLTNTPALRTDQQVRDLADEQITASSPFDGDYGSLTNTPDLSGITTNASNISTNTSAIAGKFDEPTGTPSTGDVIEWSGSEAQWAAPATGGGGSVRKIWSSYVQMPWTMSTFDVPSFPSAPQNLGDGTGSNIDTITINPPVTFVSSSATETSFTVDETGSYRISATALVGSNGPDNTIGGAISVEVNGTWKHGISQIGTNDFNAPVTNADSHVSVSLDVITNLSAGDDLDIVWTKNGTANEENISNATLIIEKVG